MDLDQWRLVVFKVREEGCALGCHWPASLFTLLHSVWWHKYVRLSSFRVWELQNSREG